MEKGYTIRYTGHGLANTIGNTIYMNKLLLEPQYLPVWIILIMHERKHVFGKEDPDKTEEWSWKVIKFCLMHPSTWTNFLPVLIFKHDSKYIITYSKRYMILWSFMILWSILMWYIWT